MVSAHMNIVIIGSVPPTLLPSSNACLQKVFRRSRKNHRNSEPIEHLQPLLRKGAQDVESVPRLACVIWILGMLHRARATVGVQCVQQFLLRFHLMGDYALPFKEAKLFEIRLQNRIVRSFIPHLLQ